MTPLPSPQRRREIIDALRRGTVPQRGPDAFAVGIDGFVPAIDEGLDSVAGGAGQFKAVRGEYGSGKTFFSRWLAEHAKARGLATAEIQISETETPLHKLETVYRRLVERLSTADTPDGAFRSVLERWTYTLEEEVLAVGDVRENETDELARRVDTLMEQRLAEVSKSAPAFATAVRAQRAAALAGDRALAEGTLAWLGAQPTVPAAIKRAAGVKGEIDNDGALAFLRGLLTILRDAGHPGLLVILDEIETLQRVRSDVREKALNALRQLIDEIDGGRFPGLYLVITGTPAFYDGSQGAQRLAPLAQRLHTDFTGDPRFDNPRAVQLRLPAFNRERLVQVGTRVRDIYADGGANSARIHAKVDDAYVETLASAVAGELGGDVGIAPRVFLKKLVGDVLDRVDQFDDFDPRQHYALTINTTELTAEEHERRAAGSVDDIDLDL